MLRGTKEEESKSPAESPHREYAMVISLEADTLSTLASAYSTFANRPSMFAVDRARPRRVRGLFKTFKLLCRKGLDAALAESDNLDHSAQLRTRIRPGMP
jgi:hypothetical protein